MFAQDTPHPPKVEYRGADWGRITRRWTAPEGRLGPRRGPPGLPAGPRLGSSAHFDTYREAVREYTEPAYLWTLKRYGANGGKLVMRSVHERPELNQPGGTDTPPKDTGMPRIISEPYSVKKSAWRARSNIADWIRMTCTPDTDYRLVTLTKRGGMASLDEVWECVGKFRRQVDAHYAGVKTIAVPEIHHGNGQNRDTFHVHCVMVFHVGVKPLYKVFHRLWYIALGGTGREMKGDAPGNCDFARTHGSDGRRFTACQAARYISKYVTKDVFVGNVGQKRFTVSHGAATPATSYGWQPVSTSQSYTRAHAVSLLRRYFPADTFTIYSNTFHDGGDTYHTFSAEPLGEMATEGKPPG